MYQESFWKTILKKSIFKVDDPESISKILEKHLRRNLHFRKLFCIYEQNLWNMPGEELFFQFIILIVIFVSAKTRVYLGILLKKKCWRNIIWANLFGCPYHANGIKTRLRSPVFVIVHNAPLLKLLTSVSVNQPLETQWLFILFIIKTK